MRIKLSALIIILIGALLPLASYACFDTYLFQQRGGMVYPYKVLVFDSNGEYIVNDVNHNSPNQFSGAMNVYYGLSKWMSVQAQFGASEQDANQTKFDNVGLRGVFHGLCIPSAGYNLDVILEHNVSTTNDKSTFEYSMPSIWHTQHMTYVVHPVAAFESHQPMSFRGHGGVFYHIANNAILGVGAEYESAQSSSNFGKRLVKGDSGTSLFFGSSFGPNLYLQNEIIKGWGAGGSDFGFAFTAKIILPGFIR